MKLLMYDVSFVRLPWEVTAVMLADTFDGYRNLEQRLVTEFLRFCAFSLCAEVVDRLNDGLVHWLERPHPRKYIVSNFAKVSFILFSLCPVKC